MQDNGWTWKVITNGWKEQDSQDQRWKRMIDDIWKIWKICNAMEYGWSLPPVQSASGRGKVNGGLSGS